MSFKNGSIYFTDGQKLSAYSLENQFAEHLEYTFAKDARTVTPVDAYKALATSIRDRLIRKWLRTQQQYRERDVKKVYYFSLEFLIGRLLGNMLINTGVYMECYHMLHEIGYELEKVRELERDMGLGNGGLGRLAACFLDSLATMEFPATGYGLRYDYGIFEQDIRRGYQVEKPDNWLRDGNPWEIMRPELSHRVKFNGSVHTAYDLHGRLKFNWAQTDDVFAVAYDIPIPGYLNNTVNSLRLWQAKATEEFDFDEFNQGDYLAAVHNKDDSETISKVLYPNDNVSSGKILRFKQQYFFVSASLQDIIREFRAAHDDFHQFPDKVAIQLNDTHPAIAIPELMRLLVDYHDVKWEDAWKITTKTFGYTNHTVLPEALESWEVHIFETILPRHLQIIYEINQRFLDQVRLKHPGDEERIRRMSIIDEGQPRRVRMANLAIIGSHAVNGVAKLHTEILTTSIFRDFYEEQPKKFSNQTNGITQRRWLKKSNPLLAQLISDTIGDGWVIGLDQLRALEKSIYDPGFTENWHSFKWVNKQALARHIRDHYGVTVNPDSMFDVQIKRIHEYKRQLLNVLHVITLYNRIRENRNAVVCPRTVIFSGKAAPGYMLAKLIIKLIHSVADTINHDPVIKDNLKVVFLKNYSVSLAERIVPAADLSEQISTAGYEASGTGNMKLSLNGALTIGTMDGANIEIRDEVGDDNIFIFGLRAEEVRAMRAQGYQPVKHYDENAELREALDMIRMNFFNPGELGIFEPIFDTLIHNGDYYMLLADYASYIAAQENASRQFCDQALWTKKSILNVAHMGKFSSDRTICGYAKDIWNVTPAPVIM